MTKSKAQPGDTFSYKYIPFIAKLKPSTPQLKAAAPVLSIAVPAPCWKRVGQQYQARMKLVVYPNVNIRTLWVSTEFFEVDGEVQTTQLDALKDGASYTSQLTAPKPQTKPVPWQEARISVRALLKDGGVPRVYPLTRVPLGHSLCKD